MGCGNPVNVADKPKFYRDLVKHSPKVHDFIFILALSDLYD